MDERRAMRVELPPPAPPPPVKCGKVTTISILWQENVVAQLITVICTDKNHMNTPYTYIYLYTS